MMQMQISRKNDANIIENSRFVAVNEKLRGISRNMKNFAIFRGNRQISQFRTHRDKFLSLSQLARRIQYTHFSKFAIFQRSSTIF